MKQEVVGEVTEILPNLMYRVALEGKEIIAYCSGKMKVNKIKILLGDYVNVELDPYGGKTTNRIIKRQQRHSI